MRIDKGHHQTLGDVAPIDTFSARSPNSSAILAAARARRRLGGRPSALDADKRALAVQLYREKRLTVAMMGISKPTLYAYIARCERWLNSSVPAANRPK